MIRIPGGIPDPTIRVIARTLYRKGQAYGFAGADYLRLINELLELALRDERPVPAGDPIAQVHAIPDGNTPTRDGPDEQYCFDGAREAHPWVR